MIDSTYVQLDQGAVLEFTSDAWQSLCARFVSVVIERRSVRPTPRGHGFTVVDGEGAKQQTWWGIEAIMDEVFPDRPALVAWASQQVPFSANRPGFEHQLLQGIYKKLLDARVVVTALTARAKQMADMSMAEIEAARAKVQATLRLSWDEDYGLPVQFIVPNKSPHQMYILAGAQLRYVADVRDFSDSTPDTLIGNLQNDVDVSCTIVDPVDTTPRVSS